MVLLGEHRGQHREPRRGRQHRVEIRPGHELAHDQRGDREHRRPQPRQPHPRHPADQQRARAQHAEDAHRHRRPVAGAGEQRHDPGGAAIAATPARRRTATGNRVSRSLRSAIAPSSTRTPTPTTGASAMAATQASAASALRRSPAAANMPPAASRRVARPSTPSRGGQLGEQRTAGVHRGATPPGSPAAAAAGPCTDHSRIPASTAVTEPDRPRRRRAQKARHRGHRGRPVASSAPREPGRHERGCRGQHDQHRAAGGAVGF